MSVTDTCASVARDLDEPRAGTAPLARGWMAVEVPGPWGREGLADAGLDPAVTGALAQAAADRSVRLQLIRRPRSRSRHPRRRTVVLAHSGVDPWCELIEVDDAELAAIDPGVCASPVPPRLGRPQEGPLVLVCTHARRDRCCATLGRPVADTLSALHPGVVWETSHTGGHRFAANLVVLPHGLVYGGLDVADAVETVARHLAGRIHVEHLRGRSSLDRTSQAVEAQVRQRLALDRLDAHLAVAEGPARADGEVEAIVDTPVGRFRARLRSVATGTPHPLSCDSGDLEDPPAFRIVDLVPEVG